MSKIVTVHDVAGYHSFGGSPNSESFFRRYICKDIEATIYPIEKEDDKYLIKLNGIDFINKYRTDYKFNAIILVAEFEFIDPTIEKISFSKFLMLEEPLRDVLVSRSIELSKAQQNSLVNIRSITITIEFCNDSDFNKEFKWKLNDFDFGTKVVTVKSLHPEFNTKFLYTAELIDLISGKSILFKHYNTIEAPKTSIPPMKWYDINISNLVKDYFDTTDIDYLPDYHFGKLVISLNNILFTFYIMVDSRGNSGAILTLDGKCDYEKMLKVLDAFSENKENKYTCTISLFVESGSLFEKLIDIDCFNN